MNCFICDKHQRPGTFTGENILERGGLILTHFPKVGDDRATRGHLIIEPLRHITRFSEMTAAESESFGMLVREAEKLILNLGAEHVYLVRINDKVPHLHTHLVPRYPNTPKEFWGPKIMEWPGQPQISLDEIKILAKELRANALDTLS